MSSASAKELVLSKLTETNRRRFWYKFLKTSYVVQDVDLFAAASLDGRARRLGPESVETKTKACKRRPKLAWSIKIFCMYSLAKMVLISFVQYSLLSYEYLKDEKRGSFLLSRQTCRQLESLLGNPLASIKDFAMLAYVCPAGFNFVLSSVFWFYHKHFRLIDIAPLRLLLEPELEFSRIDARVRAKLEQIQCSLKIYRKRKLAQFGHARAMLLLGGRSSHSFKVNLASRSHLDALQQSERLFCDHIGQLLGELIATERADSLRPSHLTLGYLAKMSALMGPVNVGLMLAYLNLASLFTMPAAIMPIIEKCNSTTSLMGCNILRVYSLPELLLVLESMLAQVLGAIFFIPTVVAPLLLMMSQLRLINSVISELAIYQLHALKLDDFGRAPDRLRWRRHPIGPLNKRLELGSLINLLVANDELRRNAKSISFAHTHRIYFTATVLLWVAINSKFRTAETNWLRYGILAFIWVDYNLLAIASAAVYSKTLRIERALWSHLAANIRIRHILHEVTNHDGLDRDGGPILTTMKIKCCSFLIEMLTKFVRSFSQLDVKDLCPRFLFLELSYERIIQANFLLVFVYLFTSQPS